MDEPTGPILIAALYKFTPLKNCERIRASLAELCLALGIKGTLLLAREGVNGTVAGTDEAIGRLLDHIRQVVGTAGLELKFSRASAQPFHRMKVRIKQEIVTMGEPNIDPIEGTGQYVTPEEWNTLIQEPGTIIIDTRNDYEVAVGSFPGAINPSTRSFREFPQWFLAHREHLLDGGTPPKVAMFCTGGIRCEKSTAYLRSLGVENVFHLQGGILRYLEIIPEEASLWQGECFVFDERVTVGPGLQPGTHVLCRACRRPVSPADRTSSHYEPGVSCPACYAERTESQRAGYRERYRQECLAAARGEAHVGASFETSADSDE